VGFIILGPTSNTGIDRSSAEDIRGHTNKAYWDAMDKAHKEQGFDMNFSIRYGVEDIDWVALCEIFRLAPLGTREPEKLRIAATNSHTVCAAFIDETIIGFGRAISDGQYQSAIYDVVVLPRFQNQGVGKAVMKALLRNLPPHATVLIYVAPGKENFYRKFGFGKLKTGMGLFPNPEMSRAKGYLE
jgi:aralkylamine N-acetyltransferase